MSTIVAVIIQVVLVCAILVMAVAVTLLPPSHRGFGLCAGIAAIAVAGLLGSSEAGGTLAPDTWLLAVATALAALAWLLRAGFGESDEGTTETDHKTEVFR